MHSYFKLLFLTPFLLTACQPLTQVEVDTPPEPQVEADPVECPTMPVLTECPVCPLCPTPTQALTKPAVKIPLKPVEAAPSPMVIGALEHVTAEPPGIKLTARIDTGAKSSSIHASNVVRFEREGERWVSFDISDDDGALIPLKMPVERRVRITQANGEIQRRYVVKMWLSLGDIREKVDVTLADRGDLTYPLLIGRNFLMDIAIVDVSKKFTQ